MFNRESEMNQAKRQTRARRKAKACRLARWQHVPTLRSKHVAEGAR
jgi:hypothetical protein